MISLEFEVPLPLKHLSSDLTDCFDTNSPHPACSPEPFAFTHLLLHDSLYLLGPPFLHVVPLPQHPLRLDLCHMSWKACPETHLPLLVLVTCPSHVSLVTLILTHVAAFTVGFQRLHTGVLRFMGSQRVRHD